MLLPHLQYAFYILNPTFLSSALILNLLVLFSLASLLMNTISYSKIAVTHMLIFLFATFCIPKIPVSISIDILITAYIVIAAMKAIGGCFSILGRTHYTIEKIGGLFLGFVCTTIVLDVIFTDTSGFEWKGTGESSFVVGGIGRLLVGAEVEFEDAAEMLFAGYFLAFCVVVMVGVLTEAWFWAPGGIMIYLNHERIRRDLQRLWRHLQQLYGNQ